MENREFLSVSSFIAPFSSTINHEHKRKTRRTYEVNVTRMWANAQRDGRPAEYRWCPLFNAAMFG